MLFKKWYAPFLEAEGTDGGGTATEPAQAETVTEPAPESTSEPEPAQSTATASTEPVASASTEEGTFGLYIDKETGKPTLKRQEPESEPEQPEQPKEEPEENYGDTGATDVAEEGAQEVSEDKPKYNLDEFSSALATGNIDTSRIPQEYQAQYAEYRIRQAMNQYAAQQKAAAQAEEAKRKEINKQMSPEEQVQANKNFYRQLDQDARKAALGDLGLTEEQLDNALLEVDGEQIRADYETAYQWHKQNLANKLFQQQNARAAQQQRQDAIYQDIRNYAAAEKAKDPANFEAIDHLTISRLQEMPYAKAQPIVEAFKALQNGTVTTEQTQILQKHFEETKKEYIAKKNGLSTKPKPARKPPVVENAGNGQQTVKEYTPDYAGLRNAKNIRERRAWLQSFVKNTMK